MQRTLWVAVAAVSLLGNAGCGGLIWAHKKAEITAVSLNSCDAHCGKEAGIPFYLPKPLLIVSKNFRNIEEAKTGLTDPAPIPGGFDDQAKYADLNARTNFAGLQTPLPPDPKGVASSGVPGSSGPYMHSAGAPLTPDKAPSDGLAPNTFYTYQIVFVPDMTQKYGLRIKGGPGEIRAAMNLVNGWQFTGIGPFYLKDSSTAQNILASGISSRLGGQAAADVLNASANLARAAGVGTSGDPSLDATNPAVIQMSRTLCALPLGMHPAKIENFAEIKVYEPHLTPEGLMEWKQIVDVKFDRDFMGQEVVQTVATPLAKPATLKDPKDLKEPKGIGTAGTPGGTAGAGAAFAGVDNELGRAALSAVFGPGALTAGRPGSLTAGPASAPAAATPAIGGINQIQVGGDGHAPSKQFNLFNFGGHKAQPARPVISHRAIVLPEGAAASGARSPLFSPGTNPTGTGGVGTAGIPGEAAKPTPVFTQTINQQVVPTTPAPAPPMPPATDAPLPPIKPKG